MAHIPINRCRTCSIYTNDLKWCECSGVRYCSNICKQRDRQRHTPECTSLKRDPILLSAEHERILNLLLDPQSMLGDRIYPFLYARAQRDRGDLFIVPLIRDDPMSLRKRVNLTDSIDALLVTWSPTDNVRPLGTTPTFMYVIDETNWTQPVAVLSYGMDITPSSQHITWYELEMERLGFLSGLITALITADGNLQRVATKDVFPITPTE